ncbi:MAG: DMT family transporter [Sneathiellaceae bacterium]
MEQAPSPRPGAAAPPSKLHGALLTLAGVLVLSTDSLLVRLIDGDALTIVFWRGLLMALGFWLVLAVQQRAAPLRALLLPSRPTLLAAVLFAGSTLCFVGAIKHAPVADVLLILAVIPLTGALLSWLFLGERVARVTWLAMLGAMLGLALVVGGQDRTGLDADWRALAPLRGHALALGVTLFIGGYFTVLRSGRVGNPLPALCIAGLLCALVAAILTPRLDLPVDSWPQMLLLGLVVMPVSFGLISLGPRSLPAAEVGLIMLLEAVFGGALAWIFLYEPPAASAALGGAVVILSVGLRALALRRADRPA